jgi:hypothetical protein
MRELDYAHKASKDIRRVPPNRATYERICNGRLQRSRVLRKSGTMRATRAMYIRIPAEAHSNSPSTIRAVAVFARWLEATPIPTKIPSGVVIANKPARTVEEVHSNAACIHITVRDESAHIPEI